MPNSFDVVVIGAGIMGCCSALELARTGLKVAVIDKTTIGAGPTGKSSAIIRQHYSNELTARMALHSLSIFQNFDEMVGGDCGFNQAGFVLLVDEKDKVGLEANISFQQALGIDTALLTRADAKEIMPGLELRDQAAVAFESGSGYADPYLTVNRFAEAAKRLGVQFFLETEVTNLHIRSAKVVGLESTTGRFNTSIVINCTGAWAGQVSKLANVNVPINSCRVQVAFFRRPPGQEASHPVIADFINATYFRSETGGLTLVGLIDPTEADAIVDPDKYREYMDDGFMIEAGERLINRYPAMEHSQTASGYASLYAITPDWHPIIDEVPRGSGFFVCSGFSGHGFKLGPAVGLMIAELINGVDNPKFDSKLFNYSRFGNQNLIEGKYEYSIVG